MRYEKSEKIYKEAIGIIPGGVNSPVRAFQSVGMDFPIFVQKGDGAKIYDVDGNSYIDFICSWGPLILGHKDKDVVKAVQDEVLNGSSYGLPTEKEVDLAKLILSMVPNIDKVRLTSSGTEAVMAAVRLARAATKRKKIIKFDGCYHGHSDSMLVSAGSGVLTFDNKVNDNGIIDEISNQTLVANYNDLESVQKLFIENKDEIAAIIVEPIAANMGVVIPKQEFIEGLRKICDENSSLLIFDEVITGFRVAPGGAQEYLGIKADIVTFGKIIGGGYPIGAFAAKNSLMDLIAPTGSVYHAGTLSGNPVSVAAGLTTLNRLKNKQIYQDLEKKTEYICNKIAELGKKHNISIVINRVASLYTIFFCDGEVNDLNDSNRSSGEIYEKFFKLLLDNGVVIAPSKYEAHFLSIAHTDEIIDEYLKVIDRVLGEL